jgi:hypothetical protein
MIRMLQEFRENQLQESVVIGTIRSINELQPLIGCPPKHDLINDITPKRFHLTNIHNNHTVSINHCTDKR